MDFLRVIRQLFKREKSTALALVPAYIHKGTWLQVTDSGSRIVRSYVYKCRCGQIYEYGTGEANESRMHTCICGAEFSLLRSLDALDADGKFKVEPAALAERLSSLAIQRVAKLPARPPFVHVGGERFEVEWGGADGRQGARRDEAFFRGDAECMGPGFSAPYALKK